MLHPSYVELIDIANKGIENEDEQIVQSRYSIVIAAAKRARQLIDGQDPLIPCKRNAKPLSIAVEELRQSKVNILSEGSDYEEEEEPVETVEPAETEEPAETTEAEAVSAEEVEETNEVVE